MSLALRHIYLRETAANKIRRLDLGRLVIDWRDGLYASTNPNSRHGQLAQLFRRWCSERLEASPSHVQETPYDGVDVLDVSLGMFSALHVNRVAKDTVSWAFDGEIDGLPIPSVHHAEAGHTDSTMAPSGRRGHDDDVLVEVPVPRWLKTILPSDLEALGRRDGYTVLAAASMLGTCLEGRHVQRCQAFTVQEIIDECGGEDESVKMWFTKDEWSTFFMPFAREIRCTSNRVTVLTALMIGLGLPGALNGTITAPWLWHPEWKKAAKTGVNFIECHHDRDKPFQKTGCSLSIHHLALVATLSGYRVSPAVPTCRIGQTSARENLCRLWIKLQEQHGHAVGKGNFDLTLAAAILGTVTQTGERSWLSDFVCPPKAFASVIDGLLPMEGVVWSILSQNRVSSVGAALRKRWKQQCVESIYNSLCAAAPLHPGWVSWWREIGKERYGNEGTGWLPDSRMDRHIDEVERAGMIVAEYNIDVKRELQTAGLPC